MGGAGGCARVPHLSPEAEFIESANALASLIEAQTRPKLQVHRDKAIAGPLRVIRKLSADRFRAQLKAVLDSHAFGKLGATLAKTSATEALREADDKLTRDQVLRDATNALGAIVTHQPVTADEQNLYAGAIRKAIDAGNSGISEVMGATAKHSESFISEYLKDAGFSQLTGEIDKTTVDRLAGAIEDAYESGADFDQTVSAVRREFADMTQQRAQMIAQTELNDAYNQSIFHFGKEAGATRKSWQTDLAPCPICVVNAFDGEIDIDEDFASGDDAPPAHPSCLCSLLVHANN